MHTDSPEDRLLRLIKGKHKKKRDIKQISPALKPSFLKPVNKILTAILIALSGYFIYSLSFPVQKDIDSSIKGREIESSTVDIEQKEEAVSSYTKDYSAYLEEIGGKKLFGPPLIEESGQSESRVDIAKRFNLVGILAGVEPQAIIEDKETQKTYYLCKGQSFNGVTVEEITDGSVVLKYRGIQITLVL